MANRSSEGTTVSPQTSSQQSFPEQVRSGQAPFGDEQAVALDWRDSAPEPPRPPMARRSVLRGAASVGAVVAAAAVGAGGVVAFDPRSAQLNPVSKPKVMAPMAPAATSGPLVVYISDTSSGLFDVYAGTGATQVRNPALVRQILANLKLA
jgi:hypothetical protein